MNRESWLNVLGDVLEPVADPTRAAMGVMRPKAGCHVTLQLTYNSVSAFTRWEILTSREDLVIIHAIEDTEEAVHILPWANIGTVSVSFDWPTEEERQAANRFFLGLATSNPAPICDPDRDAQSPNGGEAAQ